MDLLPPTWIAIFCGAVLASSACAERVEVSAPIAPAAPASSPNAPADAKVVEPPATTVTVVTEAPVADPDDPAEADVGPYLPAELTAQAPELGPFDKASLPSSKYALLMVVDAALRAGDASLLGRVVLDEQAMRPLCSASDRDRRKLATMGERRTKAARRFAECAAFVPWQRAERLALHSGSISALALRDCGLARERGTLVYAIDEATVEVEVGIAVMGDKRALLVPIRCFSRHAYDAGGVKRHATPAEMKRDFIDERRTVACPALGWPHVSGWEPQGRPVCPR